MQGRPLQVRTRMRCPKTCTLQARPSAVPIKKECVTKRISEVSQTLSKCWFRWIDWYIDRFIRIHRQIRYMLRAHTHRLYNTGDKLCFGAPRKGLLIYTKTCNHHFPGLLDLGGTILIQGWRCCKWLPTWSLDCNHPHYYKVSST